MTHNNTRVAQSSPTLSRRSLLQYSLGTLALAPLLTACGVNTSGAPGGGGGGSVGFLSTQFTPVQERQAYEAVLRKYAKSPAVAYNSVDSGVFNTTITAQLKAGKVNTGVIGGLHSDLVPFANDLEDLSALTAELSSAGYPADLLTLAELGTGVPRYIPWMEATYVVAVNRKALEWLPSGADVHNLTYDQFLAWAKAAHKANGKPVFGFPAGPKGLHQRFYQGYLLPSFTGGQITTFMNNDAVGAWGYMKELWAEMNPASTNYNFMQEPLASGEVLVAWDHVARLVGAVGNKPDEWLMVQAPTGPKGLGYLLIVAGLAVAKGDANKDAAIQVIKELSTPNAQLATLASNAFFPTLKVTLGKNLPPAIALEATAVAAQQNSPKALLALPPVGLGSKDPEVSQIFKNCFTEICLNGAPIASTLKSQGAQLEAILKAAKVPCWAPDPAAAVCSVG
ncbi:MAG: ABC transporter substrate-binding protein [Lacisediminihabitans sp.]